MNDNFPSSFLINIVPITLSLVVIWKLFYPRRGRLVPDELLVLTITLLTGLVILFGLPAANWCGQNCKVPSNVIACSVLFLATLFWLLKGDLTWFSSYLLSCLGTYAMFLATFDDVQYPHIALFSGIVFDLGLVAIIVARKYYRKLGN